MPFYMIGIALYLCEIHLYVGDTNYNRKFRFYNKCVLSCLHLIAQNTSRTSIIGWLGQIFERYWIRPHLIFIQKMGKPQRGLKMTQKREGDQRTSKKSPEIMVFHKTLNSYHLHWGTLEKLVMLVNIVLRYSWW